MKKNKKSKNKKSKNEKKLYILKFELFDVEYYISVYTSDPTSDIVMVRTVQKLKSDCPSKFVPLQTVKQDTANTFVPTFATLYGVPPIKI